MNTIALDADGVLLDYNVAYAAVWARAFDATPILVNPHGYHARSRYGLPELSGAELAHFRSFFQKDEFWETVPAIAGAVEACNALVRRGHTLVCVSAVESRFQAARLRNLQALGFPIEQVFAAPSSGAEAGSPKRLVIERVKPLAMVDDYWPYLEGLPTSVHKALIIRDHSSDSPNHAPGAETWSNSRHSDLSGFEHWW